MHKAPPLCVKREVICPHTQNQGRLHQIMLEEDIDLIVRIYDALKGHPDWNDKKISEFFKIGIDI